MTPSADQNGGIGGDSRVLFFDDFAEGDLATVLVIGAGGVGSVAVHKMAMLSDILSDITLASRRLGPCEDIQKAVATRTGKTINIAQLDADNVAETVALIDKVQPQLVVNLALPYQDLGDYGRLVLKPACIISTPPIMSRATKPNSNITGNGPIKTASPKKARWRCFGSGFDPGVTNVFTASYSKAFSVRGSVNAGYSRLQSAATTARPFATNFNPEINIREVTAPARHWENGQWVETPALSKEAVI